jgi:putative endonuclease
MCQLQIGAKSARHSLLESRTTGRRRAYSLFPASSGPFTTSLEARSFFGYKEPESIMFQVHVIVSMTHPDRYYIGFSSRADDRLSEHNAGKNPSTAGFVPWRFAAMFSFPSEEQARRFERYLKGGSGRAFLRRHVFNQE